jgi:uncharacterized membrane protein
MLVYANVDGAALKTSLDDTKEKLLREALAKATAAESTMQTASAA